jgi:hypothetical protein
MAKKAAARKGKGKVEKVMHEYKEGTLKSGSKRGPKVKSRKQAVAIALSEARKAGAKIPKKRAAKKSAKKPAKKAPRKRS